MIRDFFKDVLRYLPSQVLPSFIKLFSIPIVTRLFYPAVYGNYIIVVTTFAILSYGVSWIGIAITRFYAEHENNQQLNLFYSTVITWLGISFFIITPLFFVYLFFFGRYLGPQLFTLLIIGFVDFFISSFFWIFLDVLRAKRKAFEYSMLSVFDSLFSFALALFLIWFLHIGISSFFFASIITTLLSLFYIIITAGKYLGKISWGKNSKELARRMASYSVPVVVGNLAYWVLALSDRYVVNFFLGAAATGIYAANYSIAEKAILFFTTLFSFVAAPIGVVIWERDGEEKSKEFVAQLMRYFLIFCIPAAVGISILAKPIIRLFTAPSYYSGYVILPWVAGSMLLYGIFHGFSHGLSFHKKTHYEMWSVIIAGIVNLVLNFIFVPRFGYIAAAISTFIGYVVLLSLMVYFSRKFFKWKFPFITLAKSALASAIMALLIYAAWPYVYFFNDYINALIYIIFGIVVYGVSILALKEVTPRERKAFVAVAKETFFSRFV